MPRGAGGQRPTAGMRRARLHVPLAGARRPPLGSLG
ncbi:hypothetical protein BU14_0072s0056 [Porphyra umbilicalis]|uniref:Uncharacterized protein n=1 Tax=Porphyra umbilicalis TaxID=2786 RepID=A0A1X6PFU0_PORUM|nr:hypothetical protein BU14_0072s0056 [Porphyra umbilicalis]|eukprot:OSX79698.1 hypothetical protein BU14_0072s0056 [Porphyra umbilicalis]